MKQKKRVFSEAFKLQVIKEVLGGQLTKEEAREKYQLGGKCAVLNWMRKFDIWEYWQLPSNGLPSNVAFMKKEKDSDKSALQKRIKELERALEDAQLKAELYNRMINIAERDLNISIRKKPFTKQS